MKAVREGHHGYTPTLGILPLREAVAADLYRRFGVTVSPDQVMNGFDASQRGRGEGRGRKRARGQSRKEPHCLDRADVRHGLFGS